MVAKIQQEYDRDFYAWILHNVTLLRAGKLSEIDIEHVAEELESMGKSERRELLNRLALLISHLLKWEFQPERRSNSWKATINHQRLRLKKLLNESPSLKYELSDKISEAYENAIFLAAEETHLPKEDFPQSSNYTFEQLLNDEFFPNN
jgi:hypothetical protein